MKVVSICVLWVGKGLGPGPLLDPKEALIPFSHLYIGLNVLCIVYTFKHWAFLSLPYAASMADGFGQGSESRVC